jgi:hypothetical protein
MPGWKRLAVVLFWFFEASCGAVSSDAYAGPTFCTHSAPFPPLPPFPAGVIPGDGKVAPPLAPAGVCILIPKGVTVSDIYCAAGQDPGTTYPTTAWCVYVAGQDDGPCLAASAPYTQMRDAFLSLGNSITPQPDGAIVACANFNNASKRDTRYFNLYAK